MLWFIRNLRDYEVLTHAPDPEALAEALATHNVGVRLRRLCGAHT